MNKLASRIVLIAFVVSITFSACAEGQTTQPTKEATNTFKNDDFEITLGANWRRRENTETFEWEIQEDLQEIIISVVRSEETMDAGLMDETAKRVMKHHQAAVQEISEGKTVFSEIESMGDINEAEVVVRGIDNVYGMQVYTSVIVRPARVITFSYYKYSPLLTDEEFRKRSRELRSALKLN